MKGKTIKYILVILIMCVCLLGCGKKKNIIGSWKAKDNENKYVFNEDGTGKYINDISFKYKDEDGKVSITYIDWNITLNGTWEEDTLVITDINGDKITFSREK